MSETSKNTADYEVERLKEARTLDSVLKLRIELLRSRSPDVFVFAFEGVDDKAIYARWIGRLRPDLRYEPFLCNGKRGVRQLSRVVFRDRTGLREQTFFFVDRDFADLKGFEDLTHVFVTDRYSVENYLVSPIVLDQILRDDFPCHERPDIRARIVGIFGIAFAEFLSITKEVNRRLFVARRLDINLVDRLPVRASVLATIGLESVTQSSVQADRVVVYSREPTSVELANIVTDFDIFEPEARFRGKFSMLFFQYWLQELCKEYDVPKLGFLRECAKIIRLDGKNYR